MARGSSAEMEVLLSFMKDFGYISEEEYAEKQSRYEEIGKMLTELIRRLRETSI